MLVWQIWIEVTAILAALAGNIFLRKIDEILKKLLNVFGIGIADSIKISIIHKKYNT